MRTGRRNIFGAEGSITDTDVTGQAVRREEITYLPDMTRPYHNMLSIREGTGRETLYLNDGLTAEGISRETGRREYYISDEYGSPVRYTDENGNTTGLYGYDEYGARTDLLSGISEKLQGYTTVNTEAEAYAAGIYRPFTFTGYMEDEVSGLYFAQAREYDPASGRFAGKDWVKGYADRPYTLNEYGYCWNSPKKYVDKDGRIPTVVIGAAVGFLVGGISEGVGQVLGGIAEGKSLTESLSDINGWAILIKAGAGAAKGAIAGTGVGAAAMTLAFSSGAIDATASVLTDTIAYGKDDVGEIAINAVSAGAKGVIGGSEFQAFGKYDVLAKVAFSSVTDGVTTAAKDVLVEKKTDAGEVIKDAGLTTATSLAVGFVSTGLSKAANKHYDAIDDVRHKNYKLQRAKDYQKTDPSTHHIKLIDKWSGRLKDTVKSYTTGELIKGVGKSALKKTPALLTAIAAAPVFNTPVSVS